ncbi:MAG: glucose 1-dehydrogenase [Candidatus Goldiibacteriota bacterium]
MVSERKTAILTGGAQGIGKCTAKRLIKEGFCVISADIDAEAGAEMLQEPWADGRLRFIRADVSAKEDVESLITDAVNEFGRIDVLVNNAGIGINKNISEMSLDEWTRVINVNLTSVFLTVKYASKYIAVKKGSVVNIASTRAYMSEADTEAYSASKGGMAALTHSLAVSLGPDIRVNSVSPGWIDTSKWKKKGAAMPEKHSARDHKQHPAGRIGEPEDVAGLVYYLISDEASFITGQNFITDGGMTIKMIYE